MGRFGVGVFPARSFRTSWVWHPSFLLVTFAARRGGQKPPFSFSAGGATRPISAAQRPRAPPAEGAEAGNRRPGEAPTEAPGPPEDGGSPGTRRAAGRHGRRERGRPHAQGRPKSNADRDTRQAMGGQAAPAAAGAPAQGPDGPRQQGRHAGAAVAKKAPGGRAQRARQRGTSDPGAGAHTLEGLGTPAGTGPGAQPGEERGPERRAHPRERAAGPPDEPGRCTFGLLKGWLWRAGRWWQCRRLCPAQHDRGTRWDGCTQRTLRTQEGGSLALAASLPHWYTEPTGPGIGRPGGR